MQACSVLHRHHAPPQGALFAIACRVLGQSRICGIALVGRPVSRMLDDGFSVEVLRLATDETRNACSFLYGQVWRVAQSLGYKRLYTYTLTSESGASCRAANLSLDAEQAGGGSWDCSARPRKYVGQYPIETKRRWYYGPQDYLKPLSIEIPELPTLHKQLTLDIDIL